MYMKPTFPSFDDFFKRVEPKKEKLPKIKVSPEELSSLDVGNGEKGIDFGNALYKKITEDQEDGWFIFKLVDHLSSLTGDKNNEEQRARADKTIRNFIAKGYLRIGNSGKFYSNIELS